MRKLDADERCSSRSDRRSRNRILSEVSVPLENQNTFVAEENVTALARINTIYYTEISRSRHNVDKDLAVVGWYAGCVGSCLPTFWYSLLFHFQGSMSPRRARPTYITFPEERRVSAIKLCSLVTGRPVRGESLNVIITVYLSWKLANDK